MIARIVAEHRQRREPELMSDLTFRGRSLTRGLKDVEATFDFTPTDAGLQIMEGIIRGVEDRREIRIDLRRDQRWPDTVKRGAIMDLDIHGHRYRGPVRYRYGWRVVFDGTRA
jgi:hypothetical protein